MTALARASCLVAETTMALARLAGLEFQGESVAVWGEGEVRRLVLFLHGSGDSGPGVVEWLRSTGLLLPPGTALLLPSAPPRPYSLLAGQRSHVWHDRRELAMEAWEDQEGLGAMGAQLAALVEAAAGAAGLPRARVALGGFSQGGHMALHAVYGQGLEVGACFALSSFLCSSTSVTERLRSSSTPLLLSTGTADGLVEEGWVGSTASRLAAAGVEVEHRVVKGLGHDMARAQLEGLMAWLGHLLV